MQVFDLIRNGRLRTAMTLCAALTLTLFIAGCPVTPPTCSEDADCASMDDGNFCTGDPVCNPDTMMCELSGDPCMEGETCNEDMDRCDACTADADCDDGLFCTGTETCTDGQCVSSGDPCADGEFCNDDTDMCDECAADSDCDDGDACTTDACADGACSNEAIADCCNTDDDCADGEVCSGNMCITPECTDDAGCDDGDDCTTDACTDFECSNTAIEGCCNTDADCADGEVCMDNACVEGTPCTIDDDCDNGDFCDGAETCVDGFCQDGENPCPDDELFCNGTESCNEETDSCENSGGPCLDGQSCDEENDECDDIITLNFTTDTDNLSGTSGNDVFTGFASATAAANTYNTGDVANGREGTDTVNLTLQDNGASASIVELLNIEILNIRQLGTDTTADQVNLLLSSAGTLKLSGGVGTDTVQLNNFDSSSTTLYIMSQSTIASTTNVNSLINTVTGSSDEFDLQVDGAGKSGSGAVKATVDLGALAFETVNVASMNNASNVTVNGTASGLATLMVTGDAALEINGTAGNNLTTLDASGMTDGGLTADVSSNTKSMTFTGSSADDDLTVGNTLDVSDSFTGGDGDDTLTGTVGTAVTFLPTIATFESLVLDYTAAGTLNLLNASGITSLDVTNTTAAATVTNASGLSSIIFDTSTAGMGSTIGYRAGDTTDVTVTIGKTTSAGNSTTAINNGALTLTNLGGMLTIESIADAATTTNVLGATNIDDATSLTLNGTSAGLTVGAVTHDKKLTQLTATATLGPVTMGGIADADLLEQVTINADGGNVALGTVDGDDTLSAISIATGTNSSNTDTTASITVAKTSTGGASDVAVGTCTITGEGDTTLVFGANTTIQTITSTGATGSVTINGTGSASTAVSVTLGNADTGETNTVTTSGGADNIVGGTGAENITAGAGADVVNTNAGDDTIDGGANDDVLSCGDGADTVDGGAGSDTIDLGSSDSDADTVTLSQTAGADTVSNFEVGTDTADVTIAGGNGGEVEVTAAAAQGALTTDRTYVVEQTVGSAASLTTGGAETIADFTDTTDVAAFLAERFTVAGDNETGVVILNNGTNSWAYYIDASAGAANGTLDAAEVTLISIFNSAVIVDTSVTES